MTWLLLILLSTLNAAIIYFALWPKKSANKMHKNLAIVLILVAFILPGGVKFYYWAQLNQIAFVNEAMGTNTSS
jgi:hypothetical protein|tara:strand:- start:46683 stop:46904 length:222 start_codon:yes stop_codon:yes gene_type:complete